MTSLDRHAFKLKNVFLARKKRTNPLYAITANNVLKDSQNMSIHFYTTNNIFIGKY